MSKRTQIIHLILFLAVLAAIGRAVDGSVIPPSGDSSIWYHSGLLVLVIGLFWVEPYFTKPADAAVNGLVVYVSTSTLTDPPNADWWSLLRFGSLGCTIVAFLVLWAGSPAVPGNDSSLVKRLAYLVVIRIGSAPVIYSAVFLLALFSYFDIRETQTRVMLVFWATLMTVKHLDIEGLFSAAIQTFRSGAAKPIGRLSRFSDPNIARFELLPGAQCSRRNLVAFTTRGVVDSTSPLGFVVAHRPGKTTMEAEVVLVDSNFAEDGLDSRHVVVLADANETTIKERLEKTAIGRSLPSIIGFAAKRSDISQLFVEVSRGVDLQEGFLLSVVQKQADPVIYQITNATLAEEATFDSGDRAYVVCDAQQLGRWNSTQFGFSTHGWVAPEHALVAQAAGLQEAAQ